MVLKKIANSPNNVVREMLEGYVEANNKMFELVEGVQGLKLKNIKKKVILIASGGSGCEPLYPGFVGDGLADAVCVGDVFAAPSAYNIYTIAKLLDSGHGVILLYGNFPGDFLNNDMATELLELDGIKVKNIILNDDISSAPKEKKHERYGIEGIIWAIKIVGAATDMGLTFEEVVRIGEKVKESIYSIPVILYAGSMPGTGELMFEMPEDCIEFGKGFNGEPGIRKVPIISADELAEIATDYLITDMKLKRGEEVCVMVGSRGSTTFMEIHILFRKISLILKSKGIKIYDSAVNRFFCPQEMGGFAVTFLRLDSELKKYYDYPAYSPIYCKR